MSAANRTITASGLLSPSGCDRYLGFYEAALEIGAGNLALFTLPGKHCFASGDPSEIRERAMEWSAEGENVYNHVQLHVLKQGLQNGRGRRETAAVAIGLASDVDARGPGRKKSPELLCPTVAHALAVAEEFAHTYGPISITINSGYGIYPIILFREPLVLETDQDREDLDLLNRRYHQALHQIASKYGWPGAVDRCDLAKIIRLPGTVNGKDPEHRMPVRIVGENPARYNVSDLEELLPELEGPKLFAVPRGPEKGAAACSPAAAEASSQTQLRIEPPRKEVIDALIENDRTFAATWNHQRTDFRDDSCSAYDLALAHIGVMAGLEDSAIAGLIDENRRRFPRPKQARSGIHYQRYLARTIAKARAGQPKSEPVDPGSFKTVEIAEVTPVESAEGDKGGRGEAAGGQGRGAVHQE